MIAIIRANMTKGVFASANDLRNVIASIFPHEAPPVQTLRASRLRRHMRGVENRYAYSCVPRRGS